MERLRLAHELAAVDVNRGVTMDMVRRHQDDHLYRKHKLREKLQVVGARQVELNQCADIRATVLVPRSEAMVPSRPHQSSVIDNIVDSVLDEVANELLATIVSETFKEHKSRELLSVVLETEAQEDRLRRKYSNLIAQS